MLKKICIIAFSVILVAGCSSRPQAPDYKSGFLKDYHLFRPNPVAEDSWIRQTRYFDLQKFKAYDKIAIAPIELWLDKDKPYQVKDNSKQEALTKYFEEVLRQKLDGKKAIVRPGTQNSLLIRIAVTHFGEKSPDFEALDVLPFRIVKNAGVSAYLMATGKKEVIGSAGLEAEFVDTDSGKGLVAVILDSVTDKMDVNDNDTNVDAIKAVIDDWGNRLVSGLTKPTKDD